MNLDRLKKRLDAVQANIAIYRNDVDRFLKKLKRDFGLKEKDIDDRIDKIGSEINKVDKKKSKLAREIEADLDKINI